MCERCRRRPPGYHWARSVWTYEGPARGAVLALKYGGLPGLVRPLGQALLATASEQLGRLHPVLLPVPLHRVRLRQRGFDACDALARFVARRLRLTVSRAIERPRGTTPQVGLGILARRRNTANAFQLLWPEAIMGRNVVLIDDVLTTGATVGVCTQLLSDAGAREVGVLTLARARLKEA